jgi:hypothetical protein
LFSRDSGLEGPIEARTWVLIVPGSPTHSLGLVRQLAAEFLIQDETMMLRSAMLAMDEDAGRVPIEQQDQIQRGLVRFYTRNGCRMLYDKAPDEQYSSQLVCRKLADKI